MEVTREHSSANLLELELALACLLEEAALVCRG